VRLFHCSFVSRHFFVANIFNELSQYNQVRRFIDIITFISATKKWKHTLKLALYGADTSTTFSHKRKIVLIQKCPIVSKFYGRTFFPIFSSRAQMCCTQAFYPRTQLCCMQCTQPFEFYTLDFHNRKLNLS